MSHATQVLDCSFLDRESSRSRDCRVGGACVIVSAVWDTSGLLRLPKLLGKTLLAENTSSLLDLFTLFHSFHPFSLPAVDEPTSVMS